MPITNPTVLRIPTIVKTTGKIVGTEDEIELDMEEKSTPLKSTKAVLPPSVKRLRACKKVTPFHH